MESSHRDAAPNLVYVWEDMSVMSGFELHNLFTRTVQGVCVCGGGWCARVCVCRCVCGVCVGVIDY